MFTPILDSSQRRPSTNSSTAISGGDRGGPSRRRRAPALQAGAGSPPENQRGNGGGGLRPASGGGLPPLGAQAGLFVQAVQEEHRSPAPARTLSVPAPPTPALPYDFSTSAVDIALFPFATWAKLMREVLSEQAAPLLASPPPPGPPCPAAGHCGAPVSLPGHPGGRGADRGGGRVGDPDWPSGTASGPGGGYGVENPGYTKTQRILASCGAAVRPLPLDGQGLRVDALEEAGVRVVHVTPSHHYPLGIIMPVARRQALLRWAEAAPTAIFWRTTTTASSASPAAPSPPCKAWTAESGWFTSTPLQRVWPLPCASATWCCPPPAGAVAAGFLVLLLHRPLL